MGPEWLQELRTLLTSDEMEDMVQPFVMPAEDFAGYFKSDFGAFAKPSALPTSNR